MEEQVKKPKLSLTPLKLIKKDKNKNWEIKKTTSQANKNNSTKDTKHGPLKEVVAGQSFNKGFVSIIFVYYFSTDH